MTVTNDLPETLRRAIDTAAAMIQEAGALLITAGAGMGIDSGLPDFRGRSGFWQAYPALGKAHIDFYSIACPDAFHTQPALAWGFYGHRLALYRDTTPHQGFALLKRWGNCKAQGCQVFTSNVDGQFQKALFDPERVVECHGSIHHLQCLRPCCQTIWPADPFMPYVDDETCRLLNDAPHCPYCGALARPNILMFGDWGWNEQRTALQTEKQLKWLAQTQQLLVIEIGAGSAIPTVRLFSERCARQYRGKLIRINPNPTEADVPSKNDISIPLGALAALNAIEHALAA